MKSDLASTFKFRKINNPMPSLTSRLLKIKERLLFPIYGGSRGGKKQLSSRNTSMATSRSLYPISKDCASKKKIKELPEFHHHTRRARESFFHLFKIVGFKEIVQNFDGISCCLWFASRYLQLLLPTVTWQPNQTTIAEFDCSKLDLSSTKTS